MKVEIELTELEALRIQLRESEHQKELLERKLRQLSEPEITKKAVLLSYHLFDNYMGAVFKHLGFEKWQNKSVIKVNDIEHWLGKNWWFSDRLTIDLCANVTTKFKSAFLKIGIVTLDEKVDFGENQ